MLRKKALFLLALASPALGGCALQAAMVAAELGPQIRGPLGPNNAHFRPVAIEDCTRRAGQYGSVFIVDVEQRRSDRIIVWGSVTDARHQRRTFECHFTTAPGHFKLGDILPAS